MVNGGNCFDTVTDRRAWARATLGMVPHEAKFINKQENENMNDKTEPVMAPKVQPGVYRAIEAFKLLCDPISRPTRDEYEELLKDENILYSPFASNLQKMEEAARRVVRDYIKEHYDEEDIIPGKIEMIRRKPTEHGWMWLFVTPQCYMEVHYDSEKSLFRVYAFEYENGSQVNADEVLHPHLNSRTKS